MRVALGLIVGITLQSSCGAVQGTAPSGNGPQAERPAAKQPAQLQGASPSASSASAMRPEPAPAMLELSLAALPPVPAAAERAWGACLAWAGAAGGGWTERRVQVSPVLFTPAAQPQYQLRLKLDEYVPLTVNPGQQVGLQQLAPEFEVLPPGKHRVLLFAQDAAQRVALAADGRPLTCSLDWELSTSEGKAARVDHTQAPVIFSPVGTLNGLSAEQPVLQFWANAQQQLRIIGPGNKQFSQLLTPGAYGLSALPSGDYQFELLAPASGERKHWTISVNREVRPKQ